MNAIAQPICVVRVSDGKIDFSNLAFRHLNSCGVASNDTIEIAFDSLFTTEKDSLLVRQHLKALSELNRHYLLPFVEVFTNGNAN